MTKHVWQRNWANINLNICRRSSISARLIPRLVTCCAPALTCTRTWPWSLSRRTVNFSDAWHTLSSQHLHAEPHCGLAASSRAASVCSMFGSIGGGWGGVGASIGSGSKLLEDVRRTESGSCLAVSALRHSLLLSTSSLQTPCWGQRRTTWGRGVCTFRNTPNAWGSITVQGEGLEQRQTAKDMGE